MGEQRHTIAVVGGTGPQGKGLAYRFAKHGHDVVVGSRSVERAQEAAAAIAGREVAAWRDRRDERGRAGRRRRGPAGGAVRRPRRARGLARGRPRGQGRGQLREPLGFDKQGPYGLDVDRSARRVAAAVVPTARVTGAFHHVSAVTLWGDEEYLVPRGRAGLRRRADAVDLVVAPRRHRDGAPGCQGGPAADGAPARAVDGRADLDQQGVQDAVGGGDLGGARLRGGCRVDAARLRRVAGMSVGIPKVSRNVVGRPGRGSSPTHRALGGGRTGRDRLRRDFPMESGASSGVHAPGSARKPRSLGNLPTGARTPTGPRTSRPPRPARRASRSR